MIWEGSSEVHKKAVRYFTPHQRPSENTKSNPKESGGGVKSAEVVRERHRNEPFLMSIMDFLSPVTGVCRQGSPDL